MNRKEKVIVAILFSILISSSVFSWTALSQMNQDLQALAAHTDEIILAQNDLIYDLIEAVESIEAEPVSGVWRIPPEVHVTWWHYRGGELLDTGHHPGNLTDYGADWIEDQLGDSPAADAAKGIAHTNSTTAYADNWVDLPDEITTGGMEKVDGTYVNDGTGQWNITRTFSPTESNTTRRVGLYEAGSGTLVATDTITPINYENGDSVVITITISVSDT